MKVLFHMAPDPEHIRSTFPLALALARLGHEIVYSSPTDLKSLVEERGFHCMPLHAEILKPGKFAEIKDIKTDEQRELAWMEISSCVADEYFSGKVEAYVRSINPTVVIADTFTFSPIQFVLHHLHVPCVQLSSAFSLRIDELPPLTSPMGMDAQWLDLEGARWQTSCLGRCMGDISLEMIISATTDSYAARFGYPYEKISFDSVFYPALTSFVEATVSASALDFPRAENHPLSYFALPAEIDRPEIIPEDLEQFALDATLLIYVSLGESASRFPRALQFYSAVIDALRMRPNWRAVIVTGPVYCDAPTFSNSPNNVMVLQRAPQLWLLARAAVFVTHANFASLREAVSLNVPMVAVPQQYDQLGIAARITHHKLGICLPSDLITGTTLTAAIERALQDADFFKMNLSNLDQACRNEEIQNRGVNIIEHAAMSGAVRDLSPPEIVNNHSTSSSSLCGWRLVRSESNPQIPAENQLSANQCFIAYATLSDALAHADGCALARVELSGALTDDGVCLTGQRLSWRWVINIDDALFEYAAWCAEMATEHDMASLSGRVMHFRSLLSEHRALRQQGASASELQAYFRTVFAQAAKLWHHGYGAVAMATGTISYKAAYFASLEAIISLARHYVGAAAGSREGADQYKIQYRLLTERFNKELERRITVCIRDAKLLA